jgi:hypothetical protein
MPSKQSSGEIPPVPPWPLLLLLLLDAEELLVPPPVPPPPGPDDGEVGCVPSVSSVQDAGAKPTSAAAPRAAATAIQRTVRGELRGTIGSF